jgi:hypothetical protein
MIPLHAIEVACFLRLTLLRLTDASLALLDHQIATQWREARERMEESRAAPLAIPAVHQLATAFATLDSLAASPNALPATAPQPFQKP